MKQLDILEVLKEMIVVDEERLLVLSLKVSNNEMTQQQADNTSLSIIRSISNHVRLFKKIQYSHYDEKILNSKAA